MTLLHGKKPSSQGHSREPLGTASPFKYVQQICSYECKYCLAEITGHPNLKKARISQPRAMMIRQTRKTEFQRFLETFRCFYSLGVAQIATLMTESLRMFCG